MNKKHEETKETKKVSLPDTNDFKYISMGMLVVVVMFVVLGLWAAFAELQTGTPASGQVIVESNKKTIQHLEGGIIKEILVKEGDYVHKGDVLIVFDSVKSKSELDSLLANYYEKVALKDRLVAQSKGKSEISFSPILNELDADTKQKLINNQQEIFDHEQQYLQKQTISTQQKVDSLNRQIETLKDNINKKNSLLESYREEAEEQKELLDQNLVDKTRYIDAQRKITSLESEILNNESEIHKNKIAIESAKNDLRITEERFYGDVSKKLSDTQTKISDMQARMKNLKAKLKRSRLVSPVDGIVMNLQYHTIGAVVAPGKPIMDIVPKKAKLIIEAKISPQFIEYVKVGNKANLNFPAFSMEGQFLKKIEGEVIYVSADSTQTKDGQSFYKVKIRLTPKGAQILQENHLKLLAGMPASVTIVAGKQTMLEYLLRPMTVMLEKAFLEK